MAYLAATIKESENQSLDQNTNIQQRYLSQTYIKVRNR